MTASGRDSLRAGCLRARPVPGQAGIEFAGPGPTLLRLRGFACPDTPGSDVHPALRPLEGDGWSPDPPSPEWPPAPLRPALEAAGEGVIALTVESPGSGPEGLLVSFAASAGELHRGFGGRSDAATRGLGQAVENWVGEGPYQLDEYPLVEAITPRWAIRRRRDAAYFPVPLVITSAGFGVLLDAPEYSLYRSWVEPEAGWSLEVAARRLRLFVLAGPSPAGVLRRFTDLVGRQPAPAAPWFLGPWVQTGQADLVPLEEERRIVEALQSAGAAVSAIETHMRRLPGGAHTGRRDEERARAALFHAAGLASLTYLNPFVAEDHESAGARALEEGLLEQAADGRPYTYPAYIGGRVPPLTTEGQLDFTLPGAAALFAEHAAEAVEDGHDGWMEDFGEYTPPDAVSGGVAGSIRHNLYPVGYHAAGAAAATAAGRPLARFGRSGWTGAAPHLPLVWGGDPSTSWGFDGLASAVVQGLSFGLSGIAFWGSDIGGFFSLGEERLDSELLIRWIQAGALSPLMRTKAGGFPDLPRPQVWEAEILPHWRRWAGFHTRLSPYLLGAAHEYTRTGMPLMRHHALTHPGDPEAALLDDQYLLGPALLAAPVLQPGARRRTVHLPAGRWVDLWRSAAHDGTSGEISLGPTRVLEGGGIHEIPAPLEEIPLLVPAGAVIPLLPPSIRSLRQPHGDVLTLLAFAAGDWEARTDRGTAAAARSGSGWTLRFDWAEPTRMDVQIALGCLDPAFSPRSVELDGRPLAHRAVADGAVLRVSLSTRRGTLRLA